MLAIFYDNVNTVDNAFDSLQYKTVVKSRKLLLYV